MNIKSTIHNLFFKKEYETPYGTFNLAKPQDRNRVRQVVISLQRSTDALTRKDIADWRNAWQMAINVDNPNRTRLYDIYNDVEVDAHLSGCVEQRKGFVKARTFKIVDKEGKDAPEAMKYFDQVWFKQLIDYCLEANYWGYSLIELGDVIINAEGIKCFDGVQLVPRKHVIPEYHRIIEQLGTDWRKGIDYTQGAYPDWFIEAGSRNSLGLYLKAALHTIPKKNTLAFWDTFSEMFGMPMRIGRTTSRNEKDQDDLERVLKEAAHNQYMIMGQDTEIEFVESGKSDSFNVYDKRIDRANSELSKLVIGQTMTIENGSSLSQSETHLEVFQNLVEADCDILRDIINNQLIPRMVLRGFPLQGLHFDWDYSEDYTPEQQVAYETMLLNNYDIAPKYFEEKYGTPCKTKEPMPILPSGGDDNKQNNVHQPNNHRPFFD